MKIQYKLFIFLFSFSLILVSVLVLLMQWSIGKGMVEYVVSKEIQTLKPVMTELIREYQVENNWQSIRENNNKFNRLITQHLKGSDFEPERKHPHPKHEPPSKFNHAKSTGEHTPPHPFGADNRPPHPPKRVAHYALLDKNSQLVTGLYREQLDYTKTALLVNGDIVGFFAISKRNRLTQGYEVDFIEQQQHYLWLIAICIMSLVALVTLPLARHIVEPIRLITRGMHKLAQGDYQQSINLQRQDELSELSRDYNELALTLAENEHARKRWLANISHELRTPVAILRGELEAMLDKVRPLTASNIASANDEVKHLQRLIDDLNLLTSADVGGMRYGKQQENIVCLIQSNKEKYRGYLADAGITLTVKLTVDKISLDITSSDKNPLISPTEEIQLKERMLLKTNLYADKNRLFQLFENIINNCIKYSSATQLTITVTIDEIMENSEHKNQKHIIITFEDNGVGVEEIHLTHLFEHLYRVEDSRNRKTGGSGLGLSICRHIVIAHQGNIIAKKASLGGLAVIITLPLI